MKYSVTREVNSLKEKLVVLIKTRNDLSCGQFYYCNDNGSSVQEYRSNLISGKDEWGVMRTVLYEANNYFSSTKINAVELVNKSWEMFFNSKQRELFPM